MALGDNEGVSTTMLVSPTSGNVGASYAYPAPIIYGANGGGMGFGGGDWGSLITLFLLFGLFGGGFGGFGGFGMGGMMGAGMMGGMFGMDFLYPWLNNSQNINDGFRAQQIGTDIGSIRDGVQGIAQQMCECCGNMRYDMATGLNGVERSVTGAQNALAQQMYANQIAELERSYAAQTATAQGFNGTQAGLADLKFTIAQEECATRNASAMNARDIIDATTRGNQAILDKLCQQGSALKGGRHASGCEDAGATEFYDVFQRLEWICRMVKCPVECHRCVSCGIHESLHGFHVHCTFRSEAAEYETVRSQFACRPDVIDHLADFLFAVEEISATWSDYHIKSDAYAFPGTSYHAV